MPPFFQLNYFPRGKTGFEPVTCGLAYVEVTQSSQQLPHKKGGPEREKGIVSVSALTTELPLLNVEWDGFEPPTSSLSAK